MKNPSNLPPGVTDKMIEDQQILQPRKKPTKVSETLLKQWAETLIGKEYKTIVSEKPFTAARYELGKNMNGVFVFAVGEPPYTHKYITYPKHLPRS